MDALDEIAEDDWELLAWRRSAATRMVIRGSLRTRTIQSDPELNARLMPLGYILGDMRDSRNEWVVPRKVHKGTPYDSARRDTDKWTARLWPENIQEIVRQAQDGELDDHHLEEQPASADHIESTEAQTEPQKPAISVIQSSPQAKVLEAFGLTGKETDEEGTPFHLTSYTET